MPKEDLPRIVKALADAYWDQIGALGLVDLWRKSEWTYYGTDPLGGWKDSVAVTFSGEADEECNVRFNHYRSIGQGILAMAGHERPAFAAKAIDSKTKSLAEAPIATGVVSNFWHDWGLEGKTEKDDETALLYGLGFQHLRWSPFAGKLAPLAPNPETGHPGDPNRKEGDVIAESVGPWRVIHDPFRPMDLEWAIVSHSESVWDLAARYPDLAEQIVAQKGQVSNRWMDSIWSQPWARDERDDKVTVWCVYHNPSDAVPEGRYAIVCGELCLYDGPAFLDELPVSPMLAATRIGQGTAYSGLWDLLVIQDCIDMGESANVTVLEAFGGQNISAPMEAGVIEDDLSGTRRLIKYNHIVGLADGGRPQAMEMLGPRTEVNEAIDRWVSAAQTISGINSTVRGQPDASLKSGAALALVQSLAVQFNSKFQAARIKHRERIATLGYKMLKKLMVSPRLSRSAGAAGNEYLKPVNQDQLEDVVGVQIETGSPLMQQAAGRLEIADKLLDRGLLTVPEQYIEIVTAGTLTPLLKSPEAELQLISGENDELREGRRLGPPRPELPPGAPLPPGMWEGVSELDTHEIHVREHRALLDLAMRKDPTKAALIEAHIQLHYERFAVTPPDMAALLGWKVMPPPPVPPPGAEGPPPPDGPPKKKGPAGDDKGPAPGLARPMGGEPPPGGPRMPMIAGTNERAPVPGQPPT